MPKVIKEPAGVSTATPMNSKLGALLLVAVAVIFSANHIAARYAFDQGATIGIALVMRSSVTAFVMLILLKGAGKLNWPPRRTLIRAAFVGCLIALQSYCLYAAVARLPVAIALLVFNTFPLILAILSFVTRSEQVAMRTWQAMPIVLLGLALSLGVISTGESAVDGLSVSGLVFAFVAACVFALALMLTTRWLGDMDGRMRTGLLMLTTAVIVATVSAWEGTLILPSQSGAWVGLVCLTVLYGTGITVAFTVLPRIGVASNAAILNVEPASALLLGWLVLGQQVSFLQVLGVLLVIVAVIYLASGKTQHRSQPEP